MTSEQRQTSGNFQENDDHNISESSTTTELTPAHARETYRLVRKKPIFGIAVFRTRLTLSNSGLAHARVGYVYANEIRGRMRNDLALGARLAFDCTMLARTRWKRTVVRQWPVQEKKQGVHHGNNRSTAGHNARTQTSR